MIKDNQKTLNRLHILMDATIIVISFLIAYYLRFYSFLTNLAIFKVESEPSIHYPYMHRACML